MSALDTKPYADHEAKESRLVVAGPLMTHRTTNGHGMAGVNDQAVASGHVVPVPIKYFNAATGNGATRNSIDGPAGGPMFPLEAGHQHAVAFQRHYFSDREGMGGKPNIVTPPLTGANADRTDNEIMVAMEGDIKPAGTLEFMRRTHGVRRLTPRECERLQGFDDDWTRWYADGSEVSDSARYRMLGNAVCRKVATWIGRRIVAAAT